MEVTTKIKRTIEIEKVNIELTFEEAMNLKDTCYYSEGRVSGDLYYKLLEIYKENEEWTTISKSLA